MKENVNKFKLYATLFSLGIAGGAIFIIPYIKFVFYDLQIEVTGMTNTQSALLLTIYAVVSMAAGVPFGIFCDKINSKKGLILSLLLTTALTAIYAYTNTSYIVSVLIWAALSVTTMCIYWPIFSKVLNIIGNKTGDAGRSGMAFGWYYAFNGIGAAIMQSICLWISTQFENPVTSFRAAIMFTAGCTVFASILIYFLFDDELTTSNEAPAVVEKKGTDWSQLGEIMKNPYVWYMLVICFVGYCMYSMASYFTPYLTAVVGASAAESGVFAIIRTYIFLILALVGGTCADKIFKSTTKWIMIVFITTAALIIGLFFIPAGANPLFVGFYTLLPSAMVQMSYPLKYAVIGEIGISQRLLATTTAIAAIAGSAADLIVGPVVGYLLDTIGNTAYYVLFAFLATALLAGALCCALIVKKQKPVDSTK
ncbi:MAG: MFS transporter [Candidatus Heteroscillospira sp.]|jgi:MFS family permease